MAQYQFPEDREPQPGDGPDYHADHAAWKARQQPQSFTQGYIREESMGIAVGNMVTAALIANPNQRLGQLLTNLSRGHDIWNVMDEEWLVLLRQAAEG